MVTIMSDDINLNKDTLEVKIGGKKYDYSKADLIETESGLKLNIYLNSAEYPDYIDLEVSVIDGAGNIGTSVKKHFKLSASWIERFFSNTVLVVSVFGGIVAATGIVIFALARRRKKKQS